MPASHPSIQSFFQKEVHPTSSSPLRGKATTSHAQVHLSLPMCQGGDGFQRDGDEPREGVGEGDENVGNGDGFTEDELSEALDPLARKWNPGREYESLGVGELCCGPKAVTFIGRVVSLATVFGKSAKQPRARGWHYVGVRGEGGVVLVKLHFANQPYPLKLGHLLSIWTAFISDISKADGASTPGIFVCANLFPGRNTSDHVMIHTHSGASDVCRVPLGYSKGEALSGLMTLEAYLNGGYDGVIGVKLLICVKSIGARKKIVKKDGAESTLVEVVLFDHTGEVKMKCWGDLIESVKEWHAGRTILLLTNPSHKLDYGGKGVLGLGRSTMVDVDPDFPDAQWLRKWAGGLMKRESVGVGFPGEIWGEEEVEEAIYGPRTALFGLRDVDEWVRDEARESFTGWISVVILEMGLVRNWRRNMLMCTECCGIPIYNNTPQTPCPHCSKPLTLSLNPKIIGTLVDETGCIAVGKLVWSEDAWEELLGRSVDDVCRMGSDEVRFLECRMVGLRLSLCFGWVGEDGVDVGVGGGGGDDGGGGVGGRLCVLGVRS
ncbi:hypothetical protein DSL72_002537 [Monilinia vaccinii-corymbosi]|uniref:Replication protein A OB domain-containing protein n=1 Tax=Monilinia vaccinii-corymbosi TaxID=61207 RepID=A0A8A3PCY2_9HELO|nr:hypothetical protein DSL72_002537 [Monilinia vaccinii-corymbosi]